MWYWQAKPIWYKYSILILIYNFNFFQTSDSEYDKRKNSGNTQELLTIFVDHSSHWHVELTSFTILVDNSWMGEW